MNILEKILLAKDFDQSTENVTRAAITLAKVFNSEIVPLHVISGDLYNDKLKRLVDQTITEKLNEIVSFITAEGIQVSQPIIKNGAVFEAIVKTALNIKANLIVTGSGGNNTNSVFKLGTTTERVIQNSEKPVLVIKEGNNFNVKTILCPVDFSDPSKRALNNAIIFARRFNAQLIVLSVSEWASKSWFSSQEDLEKENSHRLQQHAEEFDNFLTEFNFIDLNWSKEKKSGNPAQEILNTINEKSIDLLVIGTTGRTGFNRLIMGSVTEKVIREVPCSFLTLKSEDAISLKLKTNIKDFETLLSTAKQLEKDGLLQEAIEQYKASLLINSMHVPAYSAIANLYNKLNNSKKADLYHKSANDIKERIWYAKIEEEVRKLRGS